MVARAITQVLAKIDNHHCLSESLAVQNSAYRPLGNLKKLFSLMRQERSDTWYSLLLVPVDALSLFLAGWATWYLRFRTDFLGLHDATFGFNDFLAAVAVIIPIYLVLFALTRLYADHRETRYIDEIFRVALAVSTGTLAVIVILFFTQEIETSRFLIIATWVAGILFVSIGRYFVRWIERIRRRRGHGIHKVVIIGDNESSRILRNNYRDNPEQGVNVVGVMSSPDIERNLKDLAHLMETHKPSEIIQTDYSLPQEDVERLLDFADEHKLRFKFMPNVFETQSTNIGLTTVAGLPIVELKATPLEGWGQIGKRVMDLIGASIGLVILSPLFLVLAILIKMDSEGPVFVKLVRVDRDKPFGLYKFRSMIKDARKMKKDLMKFNERTGPMFKMKNDPRITKVGKFIRRTSLDELGQLINVIKGEMSLVGPRPHEPEEIARYKKHHRKLLTIKPGITGLAAISGRSDLDFEDEVRLDAYYIEHWSLLLDLKILLRTLPVVVTGKSAA